MVDGALGHRSNLLGWPGRSRAAAAVASVPEWSGLTRGGGVADRNARHAAGEDPDTELVRLAGEGDGHACAALVDRHLPRVLGMAVRMLGNRAEAEDVAQEVFLRTWRHAPDWKPGRARFSTWMYRVAMNLCHDRLRRRREVDLSEIGDPPDEAPSPGQGLQDARVAERVERALAQLPERQRQAIVLCHYEELGNIEAAAVMEIGVEALESLLSRGRRKLRELLREDAPDLIGDV